MRRVDGESAFEVIDRPSQTASAAALVLGAPGSVRPLGR
jgi:hypothetical protein